MFIEFTLRQPYRAESWRTLLEELFPNTSLDIFNSAQPLDATAPQVTSVNQLGTLQLPNAVVTLLEIEVNDQIKLARNRVALRNFIARLIVPGLSDAVLAIFHQPGSDDWRITYAAKRPVFDEETYVISEEQTAPKRFTFLVGPNEPCKTASGRFADIRQHAESLTLDHLEKAFSVEKLSKEFFATYNKHYEFFLAELTSPERITDTRQRFVIAGADTEEAQTIADKPIRDFTKKLLGRLIFLNFLQKKGWLHIPVAAVSNRQAGQEIEWSSGDKDFLRNFFAFAKENENAETFHSAYLAPLFFQALNTERLGHIFPLTGTRMPYLNGGLFDPEDAPLQSLDFPARLFDNLLDFFAEYNFTIDENDPEDHEVGIDPEMLGHIFENLLEDNKDKGAYYTPKVIVSYMCRQSLLHYLESHLGNSDALTALVEQHNPGDINAKGNWCAANAKRIASLLETVKICDPAIGSGAFPIGMLNEIVNLRTLLNAELNDPAERAKLKKTIIQKSIYGVDLDSGAVDIARLRFWLALVVDEVSPSPLPNLDYKIMQGNSLIESFHGVDLSKLHEDGSNKPVTTPLGLNQSELDIYTDAQLEIREQKHANREELLEARRAYFAARKPERKAELRATIDRKVIEHIRHYIEEAIDAEDIQKQQLETDWADKRRLLANWNPPKAAQNRHAKLLAHIKTLENSLVTLDALQHQAERPFFLWHLLFQEVFDGEGFDIVIANPPYVRQELIKEQKPLLEAEGYEVYTGTADLLVYFYERAAKTLLKPGGTLTFITSNKFYRAGYGEKLRTFLNKNLTLHSLIDFRDAPVFNGVIAYASILIGTKEKARRNHQVQALPWNLNQPAAALPLEIQNAFPVRQDSLTPDGWRLVSPAVTALLDKLRAKGTPLGRYVEGRFYYGIKTGFNEAFVIDGTKRAELIASDPHSEKIIKPFLRGRDVKRWKATHDDLYLIKIESSANVNHPWTATNDPWDVFSSSYPSIAEYFKSLKSKRDKQGITHWDRLVNRDDQGVHFWELRSCAYWQEFEKPKVIYPNQCSRNEFHYEENPMYTNQKAFILTGCNAALAAILNSEIIRFIFPYYLSPLQNGFWEPSKIFVEQFPIPSATSADKSRLTTLAERCAKAAAVDDKTALASHEHEINQIVYRLFDLTQDEINLIESTLDSNQ